MDTMKETTHPRAAAPVTACPSNTSDGAPAAFGCVSPLEDKTMHTYTEAEIHAMRNGFVIDTDADLCRQQRADQRAGKILGTLASNIHGFCVRDTMNDGRGRMSPNFKTLDEARAWAVEWVAADPIKRVMCADGIVR